MTRAEALAAAREFVDELAPRVNSRGYTDGTIGPKERVTLVLQVADWLLAGQPTDQPAADVHACRLCGGTEGELVFAEQHNDWMHAYGKCDTNGRL